MAMTAKEMLPAIGQTVLVNFESIKILAVVTDVKHVYGRARLQIEPLSGFGSQWVELSRISLAPKEVRFECSNSLTVK